MARQEFLDGGFIGKVGNLVGQHWHNKRYVRTYTKGTNPNTPAQQAARGTFAIATRLAQMAYNVNKGDEAWKDYTTNEFSHRVSVAMKRLLAGATEEQALPLYPDMVPVSVKATIADLTYDQSIDVITLSILSGDDSQARYAFFDIYGFSQDEEEETHLSGEYTYNPATKICTGFQGFQLLGGILASTVGGLRDASHTDIVGSLILPASATSGDKIWYEHGAGYVGIEVSYITILPDNRTIRFSLPPMSLPQGSYLGAIWSEIELPGSQYAEFDKFYDNFLFSPATAPYIDCLFTTNISLAEYWTFKLDLVPNVGPKVAYSAFGSDSI